MKTEQIALRTLEESVDCGTYTRTRVVFEICEGLDCPVYILMPKGEPPFTGVLAIQGHCYGSRDIVGLRADGTPKQTQEDIGYQKDFAVELVKRGFAVFAPELLGFGDLRFSSAIEANEYSSCYAMSTQLLLHGLSMAGMRVYQCMRTLDLMEQMPQVRPAPMGCMGISGGGLAACFLAALDARVQASVVSGYINTYRDSVMSIYHCVDNFPHNLLSAGEIYDIASAIAPRPLLMESGTLDDIFPIGASKLAFEKLSATYAALGAADKARMDVFEGDHQISGKLAYDFLLEHLR